MNIVYWQTVMQIRNRQRIIGVIICISCPHCRTEVFITDESLFDDISLGKLITNITAGAALLRKCRSCAMSSQMESQSQTALRHELERNLKPAILEKMISCYFFRKEPSTGRIFDCKS